MKLAAKIKKKKSINYKEVVRLVGVALSSDFSYLN